MLNDENQSLLEHIIYKEEILAIILRASFSKEGIQFFTPEDFSQQLGYMQRPKGYKIKPHLHNAIKRTVTFTQEVLFVKRGLLKVNFYSNQKNFIRDIILQAGDFILLSSGGHGFEMLEDTELIEIKQGPFAGEKDKTRF